MDKHTLRTLAAGMFISVLIMMMVTYYTSSKSDVPNEQASDLVTLTKKEHDELQAKIKNWEKQFDTLTFTEDSESKENEDSGTEPEDSSIEQAAVITRFILVIEPGTTSTEISEQLFQNDIITDEKAFNTYLAEHSLTDRIQIGEYDLNSTQSIQEIADLIAGQ